MDRKQYEAAIDAFEHAYKVIDARTSALSAQALSYLPPLEGAWSINAHLVHLLDADTNLVMRVRGSVAEPGKQVIVWDQEAWYAGNKYEASDGRAALAVAIALRAFIASSLRTLDDATVGAAHIIHPEKGRMTLLDLLAMYTRHAATHLEYVERNLAAFAKR